MAIVGLDGRALRPNTAFLRMTGFSRDEILFMEPEELAHPDDAGLNAQEMQRALAGEGDRYQIEKRWSNALGHTLWVVVSAALVRDEKRRPLYFVWHVEDWSVRQREHDKLRFLADHDPLTGLANRRRFHELLERQVARCRRYGEAGAVLVLDLDGFKEVNDLLGHAAGDEVLRSVGGALSDRVRDTDVVARLGGDEFAVLLLNVNEEYAAGVAADLREAVEETRVTPGRHPVTLKLSVGSALVTPSATEAEDLLSEADAAMYAAKRSGRGQGVGVAAAGPPESLDEDSRRSVRFAR
jgi:diguanylate cyclase (GGDEF)-like protein/PAS domain S-box-containing protein